MAKCKGCRKMILVQWWGRDPLPLPPKPFTPRSLVGMTQGARKRAWLRGALNDYLFPHQNSTGAEHDVRSDYSWSEIRVDAPFLGTKLGERLRPCPGCWNCQTTWQQSSIYSQTAVMHRHGCSHDDPSGLCCFGETVPVKMECDGSGVLPARKQK